jgi:hypothetical protein
MEANAMQRHSGKGTEVSTGPTPGPRTWCRHEVPTTSSFSASPSTFPRDSTSTPLPHSVFSPSYPFLPFLLTLAVKPRSCADTSDWFCVGLSIRATSCLVPVAQEKPLLEALSTAKAELSSAQRKNTALRAAKKRLEATAETADSLGEAGTRTLTSFKPLFIPALLSTSISSRRFVRMQRHHMLICAHSWSHPCKCNQTGSTRCRFVYPRFLSAYVLKQTGY